MDVVVLAGGEVPEKLRETQSSDERALIEVCGKPIVELVIESLRPVDVLGQIILVSTPKALELMGERVHGIPSGDKMTKNLLAGARAATSSEILIVTGDIPLVTPDTWTQFLAGAANKGLEAAYPIVRQEVIEDEFPGGKRTYGKLKDGTFTGGNAFLFSRSRLDALEGLIDTAFSARKNPMKLAGMLGLGFILRALTRQLAVSDVEMKMTQLLGCRAGAVDMRDASIAFDVDKQIDLDVAAQKLACHP